MSNKQDNSRNELPQNAYASNMIVSDATREGLYRLMKIDNPHYRSDLRNTNINIHDNVIMRYAYIIAY